MKLSRYVGYDEDAPLRGYTAVLWAMAFTDLETASGSQASAALASVARQLVLESSSHRGVSPAEFLLRVRRTRYAVKVIDLL